MLVHTQNTRMIWKIFEYLLRPILYFSSTRQQYRTTQTEMGKSIADDNGYFSISPSIGPQKDQCQTAGYFSPCVLCGLDLYPILCHFNIYSITIASASPNSKKKMHSHTSSTITGQTSDCWYCCFENAALLEEIV